MAREPRRAGAASASPNAKAAGPPSLIQAGASVDLGIIVSVCGRSPARGAEHDRPIPRRWSEAGATEH